MKIFDNIKTIITLLKKQYPLGWIGDDFIKKYYHSSFVSTKRKGIIFMCDGKKKHGGLTDRLQGLLSTYSLAKKHKIPFYINWVEPFHLTDFLLPNDGYDWRIKNDDISFNDKTSFPAIMSLHPKYEKWRNILNEFIFKSWFIHAKNQTHVYTNLNFASSDFPQLFSELFKPSDKLALGLKSHYEKLGSKYWSFSFRFNQLLGDLKDTIGFPLNKTDAELLINRNIEELTRLLRNLPSDYKAFVACDSMTFLERIKNIDSRIYFIPGKIEHIDHASSFVCSDDVWLKTFIDQHIIMNAKKVHLLRTGKMYDSGFPRFAAMIGGCEFLYHEF